MVVGLCDGGMWWCSDGMIAWKVILQFTSRNSKGRRKHKESHQPTKPHSIFCTNKKRYILDFYTDKQKRISRDSKIY